MEDPLLARRLRRLPLVSVLDREVRVACGPWARLLGLAHLDREAVGPGLLIPRCASVHTYGMRFPLDLCFLGGKGEVVSVHRGVAPRRLIACRRATAVLELPGGEGGEILPASP